MRIAICSLHEGPETEMTRLTAANHLNFAQDCGYTYIRVANRIDVSRPPSWSKVLLLLELLRQYEWVCWMDTDAVFTKDAFTLFSIFGCKAESPSQVWLFEQPHCCSLNGGVLLCKAGKIVTDLLWTLYRSDWTTYCPWWEQEAMNHYWEAGTPGVTRLLSGCRFPDAERLGHPSAKEPASILHAYGPYKEWLLLPETKALFV